MERLHSKNQLPRPHPGSPARLIEIDLHSLIGRRRKKPFTLQAKALRALAGFLSLMILFTVLSRVADSLTIARVDLQETQKRSIDHKITASGQVIANGAKTVTSFPGIRVASLAVKPGEAVAENDPLFSLSLEDLQQKLEETELELEKLNLDIRDQKSREKTEADSRSTALARALQDYNDMKSETGKAVEQAQKILTEAQNRLEEYRENPPPHADLESLQLICEAREKALEEALSALDALQTTVDQQVQEARQQAETAGVDPDEAENSVRTSYEQALNTAAEKAETARSEKQTADHDLAAASEQESSSQEQELLDAVSIAQQNFDQAVSARDSALKAAARAIEDAQKSPSADSSAEKMEMEWQKLSEKIEELQKLLENGGVVRSAFDGVVDKLNIEVGNPTPDGTAVLISDLSQGTAFIAQIPAEQEKYISVGSTVTLKPGGDQKELTGLTVESIQKVQKDSELLEITVKLPENSLKLGSSAEMEAVQPSKPYPYCVPLSALQEENGGYYLLIIQEDAGFLGPELTAARLNVDILEKNESYAAIDGGSLVAGQEFIADSNKPLEAGDRVRLNQP